MRQRKKVKEDKEYHFRATLYPYTGEPKVYDFSVTAKSGYSAKSQAERIAAGRAKDEFTYVLEKLKG